MTDSPYTEALEYHRHPTPGKISIAPTKSLNTQKDLSLAYSPGVAGPVLEIAKNPDAAYEYTSKGNLVAVISNGTAILGLGNRGALASKPVMEGKAVLFKKFAGIDSVDLELATEDVDRFVDAVTLLEPSFGGINLEDIKAPECFEIERRLKAAMKIPVFHDDQHGTAVVSSAALLNALLIAKKDRKNISVVLSGAGAAGIAIADCLQLLGIGKDQITLCDSKGVVYEGRTDDINVYKQPYARKTSARTLADALKGADVFIGVSKADTVTPEMLLSMAQTPIVFAMANPNPEIDFTLAKATRSDVILASGRSDFPNQVNNVLCFPFLFRGALDTRSSCINESMKLAAITALSALARETVPDIVLKTYGLTSLAFGSEYVLPKPFDPRLLSTVATAVAEAAMESGVAKVKIERHAYAESLRRRVS